MHRGSAALHHGVPVWRPGHLGERRVELRRTLCRMLVKTFLTGLVAAGAMCWAIEPSEAICLPVGQGAAVPLPPTSTDAMAAGRIIDFHKVVTVEDEVELHVQVYVGPRVRLEQSLDSFPAGTLVRALSYSTYQTSGAERLGHSNGLHFRPLDNQKGIGGGHTIDLPDRTDSSATSRRMLTWSVTLAEGRSWGDVDGIEDFVLQHAWR